MIDLNKDKAAVDLSDQMSAYEGLALEKDTQVVQKTRYRIITQYCSGKCEGTLPVHHKQKNLCCRF